MLVVVVVLVALGLVVGLASRSLVGEAGSTARSERLGRPGLLGVENTHTKRAFLH